MPRNTYINKNYYFYISFGPNQLKVELAAPPTAAQTEKARAIGQALYDLLAICPERADNSYVNVNASFDTVEAETGTDWVFIDPDGPQPSE